MNGVMAGLEGLLQNDLGMNLGFFQWGETKPAGT